MKPSSLTQRPAPELAAPQVIEENWEAWLAGGLRIVLIVAIALVLRAVVRRGITQLIARMNRTDRGRTERGQRSGRRSGLTPRAGAGAPPGQLVTSERRRQRSEAIGSVLRSTASLLVLGTAALMVLSQLGIELAPLVASAGIVGVAIGFGARNLVTDVLTGMFMLLEDQYGVGDKIDAGEVTGTVLEIGLRVTTLRGDKGDIWYVRNGEIKRVGNLSQGWATAAVEVEVGADADLGEVVKVISVAGEEMSDIAPWDELMWEPLNVLGLESVSLNSMVVKATAKTPAGESAQVERELRWRIKRALDAAGIEQVDAAGLTLRKLTEEGS